MTKATVSKKVETNGGAISVAVSIECEANMFPSFLSVLEEMVNKLLGDEVKSEGEEDVST